MIQLHQKNFIGLVYIFMADKLNILIIDDNVKNIQLAANVLKSTGLYNIFFATSGEKGIEQLQKAKIALVLLDINMPGLNGYETANIIKENPLTKKIPIIFLSANINKESIRKGFESGGEDYVTKPFDEIELTQRVKTHIELFCAKEALQNEVNDTKNLLEQYKVAVDVGSLVSKTDPNGRITYVNDQLCKVSKYSREELLGKNHNILRSKNMPDAVFKDMWSTITQKRNWHGVLENNAKDGSAYFVDATVIPIIDNNHEIIEYISIRTDITKEVMLREDVISTQREIIETLGELGEKRSQETGEHVYRVSLVCEVLAKAYGCSKKEVELLKMASPMHDIGKVAIPDKILHKPGPLTHDEFEIMKKHATYGYEIFNKSKHKLLQTVALIAHEHHEKWDGSGYPRGLKGEDIHLFGRISSVADVYDALSFDRVYKKAWPFEEVVAYIKNESAKSFDPHIVKLFLENLDKIQSISHKYK